MTTANLRSTPRTHTAARPTPPANATLYAAATPNNTISKTLFVYDMPGHSCYIQKQFPNGDWIDWLCPTMTASQWTDNNGSIRRKCRPAWKWIKA